MNQDYLRVFRAFSDERRLRVLEILTQGEQCACVLLRELEISQPTLSYHMKILCRSGIVKERPVGPWKYYSIDEEGCVYAQKLLQDLKNGGKSVSIRLFRLLGELRSTAENKQEEKAAENDSLKAHKTACCRCNNM